MRVGTLTVAVVVFLLAVAFLLNPAERGGPLAASAQTTASSCCTQYGRCPLNSPALQGQPCVCQTPVGAVGGFAC